MIKKTTDQIADKQTTADAAELTLEDLEKVQGGAVESSRSSIASTFYIGYVEVNEG